MWALGCILYELMELSYAYEGEIPMIFKKISEEDPRPRKNKNVSGKLVDLLDRLLNKDPKSRPSALSKNKLRTH